MYVLRERQYSSLFFACVLAAGICFTQSGYIHAKALLAQWLIASSWQSVLAGHPRPPWPWADSRPVARITYQGESQFVLSGAHGTALAFGPGHVDGSVMPGEQGDAMIAGHRDTHFSGLQHVQHGELIEAETPRGHYRFRVNEIRIVDTRVETHYNLRREGIPSLVLVTCYPFDAASRGPLRLVVGAILEQR